MSQTTARPESGLPMGARTRASGPILFLAVLLVMAVFLSWYFTWFGRDLSETKIAEYLNDEQRPRHVQHALLQIQERLERGDTTARQWYPRLLSLAEHSETEFRLTVAWVMGSDNGSNEFHQALLRLLQDPEPIVRRNAALALLRFGDSAGRRELLAILEPYTVLAPTAGTVASTLPPDSELTRGTLIARIETDGGLTEVRSPLPGELKQTLVSSGAQVAVGDPLLNINSDEESVWEALRGLALVGEPGDQIAVERYLSQHQDVSDRTRQQAELTVKAISQRQQGKE